jgi:hypothetical protein
MNRIWLRIYWAIVAMAAGSTTLVWARGVRSVRCFSWIVLPVFLQAVLVSFGLLVLRIPAYRDPSLGVAYAYLAKALLMCVLLLMFGVLLFVQRRGFQCFLISP